MNPDISPGQSKVTLRSILIVTGCSAAYLLLSAIFIGYKTDQVFLVVLFNTLYYVSAATRKFILAYLVFIIFWIIFDSMKVFPNYNFNTIHIRDLYTTEKSLFGIREGTSLLTPNEYAAKHATTFLDVMAGIFYINWMPVPF